MRGAGLVALLVVLAGCSPMQAPPPRPAPVTLKVGAVASTQWAPFYVALDRGYFDQRNLRVQLQPVRLGQDPVQLLARGELDVLLTDLDATAFNDLAAGLKFTVVASMARIPTSGSKPFVLEVARSSRGAGPVHLRGGKLAIEGGAGGGSGYLADLVLRRLGLGLQDLTVIDLAAASMEIALDAHGLDGALVPGLYSSRIEGRGLASPLGTPPAGATWDGVLFGEGLARSSGQRFFDGLVRGARDVQGGGVRAESTLSILARHTGVSASVLRAVPTYEWDAGLRPAAVPLADLQATYRAAGRLTYDGDRPAAGIIDASYSVQASARG